MAYKNPYYFYYKKKRIQRKQRIYENTVDEETRKVKFNYYSGKTKWFFEHFFNDQKKRGFTKKQTLSTIAENGDFFKHDLERFFVKGDKMLMFAEGIEFLTALGYKFTFSEEAEGLTVKIFKHTKIYTYETNDSKLVINHHEFPRFYIHVDTENWLDFEMHFIENYQLRKTEVERELLYNYFIKAMRTYFKSVDPDSPRIQMPLSTTKFRDKFFEKFYNSKEIHKNKKYLINII